jgi:hypothetical protein
MCSRPLRPVGLPIYVARVPAAPFASRAFGFAVVIRSAFAHGYGATGEMLNRYIDGGSKRDETRDLRGIESS